MKSEIILNEINKSHIWMETVVMVNYSIDEIKESLRNTFGFAVPDDVINFLMDLFRVDEEGVLDWLMEDYWIESRFEGGKPWDILKKNRAGQNC